MSKQIINSKAVIVGTLSKYCEISCNQVDSSNPDTAIHRGGECWHEDMEGERNGVNQLGSWIMRTAFKFQLEGTMKKFVNYEHLMSKVEFWNVLHFG